MFITKVIPAINAASHLPDIKSVVVPYLVQRDAAVDMAILIVLLYPHCHCVSFSCESFDFRNLFSVKRRMQEIRLLQLWRRGRRRWLQTVAWLRYIALLAYRRALKFPNVQK